MSRDEETKSFTQFKMELPWNQCGCFGATINMDLKKQCGDSAETPVRLVSQSFLWVCTGVRIVAGTETVHGDCWELTGGKGWMLLTAFLASLLEQKPGKQKGNQ